MSVDNDMRERHGRVLAELAEVGMVMVRRLGEAMLATEDVQTQAQVGLAFHRVSRAVRQTMALEYRLSREARREGRDAVAPVRAPPPTATPAPARPAPERVYWNEYERSDADEALDALDDLLEADELDVEAVHEAIEASMDRLRHDIAADPLLAGVLDARAPAAEPRTRRSELLGAAAFAPPLFPASSAGRAPPSPWRSSG